MDTIIQLQGINKTYNNGSPLHVLKGIDLEIHRGEMVSIMGASGSGKSTLLNILGILDNYDTGTYYLNGQLIKNPTETQAAEYRNRMIGFIFQSFNLINYTGERSSTSLLSRSLPPQTKCDRTRIPRHTRTARLGYSHAQRTLRRTETTGRYRQSPDYPSTNHFGRRTDRSPRQQNVSRGYGPPARSQQYGDDRDSGNSCSRGCRSNR